MAADLALALSMADTADAITMRAFDVGGAATAKADGTPAAR